MSKEEICNPQILKKRFKGIENFLKRVAFNLGNTPSQTEVKIISCIPIDVTDLQQKIIHLEKQLEALEGATSPNFPNYRSSTTNLPPASAAGSRTQNKTFQVPKSGNQCVDENVIQTQFCNATSETTAPNPFDCEPCMASSCLENRKKSNVSFVFPALNVNSDIFDCSDVCNSSDMFNSSNAPKMCELKLNNQRQTFFRKKKKLLKNIKGNFPCVYYANTNSSPFINTDLREGVPKYKGNDTMTRSYLASMISKQYKPELLGDNMSIQSQFSSPICRDVQQSHCEDNSLFESDIICSCCYGPFHNIDKHVVKPNNQIYMFHEMNTGSAFYDTNQYDLVPVKEKPVKIKKDLERPRQKEPRPHFDMKCWPEKVRTKYCSHSLYPLPTSSHCSARSRTDYTFEDKLDSYGRKVPIAVSRVEPIARILAKRRKDMYRRERSINMDTSRSCSIDFGNAYPKKNYKHPRKLERLQPIRPMKNAECLTTVINNSECQTEMSTIDENGTDSKTEATLTQIKSILQSVLAEVKVSSQTKGQVLENKPKKDAVVQKGSSRNNMEPATLMNNVTYSPYTMTPSQYLNSCSQQLSPSQFCYPNAGMKCYHNFPVFIQHPGGRHVCSNCYRTTQIKPGYVKQATTTATNTEVTKEERSKETENLIKEIYKSMALTMDYANKDTSFSEYDETMKSQYANTTPIIFKSEPKKQPTKIQNVVQAVSELFMKKDMIYTSDTLNSTIESKLPSHEASLRSNVVTSTDTELRKRKNRLEEYMRARVKHPVMPEVEKKTFQETTVQNDNSNTESETSSSETGSDTTIVTKVPKDVPESTPHKKGKESLLTKMFKSVKLFKPRETPKKTIDKSESEEESTSDSDDYQTVYSQKIEKNMRSSSRPHNLPKRKTHSKISYKQTYQRDRSPDKKRSPYMEQEYRRYWDEKLMFRNDRPMHSSGRQYSEQSTAQKSPYHRSYEARTALVEPKTHMRMTRENGTRNKLSPKPASKGMAWLKKHRMGIHCGEQWKKLIREG